MSHSLYCFRAAWSGFTAARRKPVTLCLGTALVCALAARPFACAQGPSALNPANPSSSITENDLRQQLLGKMLYLRGGYLENTLAFDQAGHLTSNSPRGSYTLCLVQIDQVRFTRHKVELFGVRYGIHFLGATPYEDPAHAFDTVNILPKKKQLHITIAREPVVVPRSKKHHPTKESSATFVSQGSAAAGPPQPAPAGTAPSQAISNQVLENTLHQVFAQRLDQQFIATMPEFWQLYYKGIESKKDVLSAGNGVYLEAEVDRKARLLARVEPPSNDYAQAKGVVGLALYRVILDADGRPRQIAVSRPIGFGLDENAVDAIRKASFQPAIKDGKPVPVLLDVLVQFRIYSKRTATPAADSGDAKSPTPVLPGPYSVNQP
jgi:TonB family protein